MSNASLLIMAGGRSERMGVPKPFLLVEGQTFIEKIAEGYRCFGVKDIFVVLNSQFIRYVPAGQNTFKIIPNNFPEYGRFFSLQTGLKAIPKNDFVFIHNVDNPFVSPDLLKEMWLRKKSNGYVVPVFNDKGGHPILISRSIVERILLTADRSRTLRDIVGEYGRIEVETNVDIILANINTWDEYEQLVLAQLTEYSGE